MEELHLFDVRIVHVPYIYGIKSLTSKEQKIIPIASTPPTVFRTAFSFFLLCAAGIRRMTTYQSAKHSSIPILRLKHASPRPDIIITTNPASDIGTSMTTGSVSTRDGKCLTSTSPLKIVAPSTHASLPATSFAMTPCSRDPSDAHPHSCFPRSPYPGNAEDVRSMDRSRKLGHPPHPDRLNWETCNVMPRAGIARP